MIGRLRRLATSAREGLTGVVGRPRLLIGTALAAALGIGLLVATVTISDTAERQVADSFDALRATVVEIQSVSATAGTEWVPLDYANRLIQLNGLVSVDRVDDYGDHAIARFPPGSGIPQSVRVAKVLASDRAGAPLDGTVRGHGFDVAMPQAPSVLIGSELAAELAISQSDGIQAIWIDDMPMVVRGILTASGSRPDALKAVVMFRPEATELLPRAQSSEIIVRTEPGAAQSVARQAPLAIAPDDPDSVAAIAPPDPDQFRNQIEGQVQLVLGAVSLVAIIVAIATIANAISTDVASRTFELGVRIAVGARPSDIFVQILSEGTAIGLTGGLLGASVGAIAAIVVANVLNWIPVVAPATLIVGVLVGTLIGAISGLAPAIRAARSNPAAALRS